MRNIHQALMFRKAVVGAISLHRWLGVGLALLLGLLTSVEASALTVSPTVMTFQAVQGANNTLSQTVTVSKSNKRQTSWIAMDNASWLTVSPGVGTIKNIADVSLTVNAAGLAAGTYTATVTITVEKGGSTSVPVTLTVAPTTSTPVIESNTMASLTWNPVSSTALAGYKVYVGTASGQYGTPLDVGNVTSYVVPSLAVGNTYYFVVTSYSTSGSESLPSIEVSKSIY